MSANEWRCVIHHLNTTGDCPRCDDELIAMTEDDAPDPHQWPAITRAQLLAGLTSTRDADQADRLTRLLDAHTTTEEDA